MSKLPGWGLAFTACVLGLATAIVASAQTFNTLVSFDLTNGSYPQTVAPVQGTDGNYYGTTSQGGNTSCGYPGCGTIFKITAGGTLTTLYSFCAQWPCPDGYDPQNGLAQSADGNFYGTTWQGGAYGDGTVFEVTPGGKLTTLYSFCSQPSCTDGKDPAGNLVLAANGNFYGVTAGGGTDGGPDGTGGTVFEITPGGKLTTLYRFCSQANCTDGGEPATGLVQGADGNFYGTTYVGGNTGVFGENNGCVVPGIGPFYLGCGTVFKITPQGKLTTLYTFCLQTNCPDGAFPGYGGALVQAANRNFYGTTNQGGANVVCVIGGINSSCGTVFEITPTGTLTTLHSFCSQDPPSCQDGFLPFGPLTLGSDGNLYGTTEGNHGGNGEFDPYSYGTIFEITPTGKFATLHDFCGENPPYCTDGSGPLSPPAQGTNGIFYGTASAGGTSNNYGTVYSLSTGLSPSVAFIRAAGKVGQLTSILGQGFTGTTSVSFNGKPATFTVRKDTFLTATVPSGATTGYLTVTTPSGTLTSNVPFHVLP